MFHSDFKQAPYWWQSYKPIDAATVDLPVQAQVVIIGAGYSGLSAALQLTKLGINCCVLDAANPGNGASTRSGGLITASGGIKTPLINKEFSNQDYTLMIKAACEGLELVEKIITDEAIDCEWKKTGYLKLATTRKQFEAMSKKAQLLDRHETIDTKMLNSEALSQEIGSQFYQGGMLTQQAAHLHPALYFKGLLDACKSRQIPVCGQAKVTKISKSGAGFSIATVRGKLNAEQVVIATNGYTGPVTPQFQKRVVPIKPYIIATQVLSDDLAKEISPKDRSFTDARRIAPFYRLSGESGNQRMIFGSRVKWKDIEARDMAPLLYALMIERFPQLEGTKITHAWSGNVALTLDEQMHTGKLEDMYYALGCNGSGVANMTYLGTQVANKIAQVSGYNCPYDTGVFPHSRFYNGRSRWFVPLIGGYLQCRDWLDEKFD